MGAYLYAPILAVMRLNRYSLAVASTVSSV